jgi:hypothetical protein
MNILLALLLASSAMAEERKHTVVAGEHLWGLSKHYYANPYKWRVIHTANEWIKDPHWIYPGQILVIPDVEVAAAAPDEPFPPAPEKPAAPVELETVFTPPSDVPVAGIQEQPKDSLSTELPDNLAGQYPSMSRLKAPRHWKPDGDVDNLGDKEALVAQGDFIAGKVSGDKLKAGSLLYVLREDAPEDDDADKNAKYLLRVGLVEVRQSIPGALLGRNRYKLLILKSGDSLQVGDVLSRKPL